MEYKVKINEFEGPLDLLLYLIKEMKISIDKINVSEITAQYIEYIHAMEKLNLEIASEYLVMAAYLTYIKSKMMLPKASIDNEDIDYEENPEEKLKRRLRIYKLFKDIIPYFRAQEDERSNYIAKIPTDLSQEFKLDTKEIIMDDFNVYDLLSAYNRVVKRYRLHKPIKRKIRPQLFTLEQRIDELRLQLKDRQRVRFIELFTSETTKELIVLTFMAILELAKNKLIHIKQEKLYQDIYIDYIGEERDDLNE